METSEEPSVRELMTKQQAFEAIKNGKKVIHLNDKFPMQMKDGIIVFEDGIECTEEEFFKYRTDQKWQTGYFIVIDTPGSKNDAQPPSENYPV